MKNFTLSQFYFPPFQDLLNGQDIPCNKLTIYYSAVLKDFSYQTVFDMWRKNKIKVTLANEPRHVTG